MFLNLVLQSFLRQPRRKLLAALAVALGATILTATLSIQTEIGDRMNHELRSLGANIVVRPAVEGADIHRRGATGGADADDGVEADNASGRQGNAISAEPLLRESELPKIKLTFWGHNILGYSPMLRWTAPLANGASVPVIGTYFAKTIMVRGEPFVTGVRKTHPWWKVDGEWPGDDPVVGRINLAGPSAASTADPDDVLVGEKLASAMHLAAGSKIVLVGETLRLSGVVSTGGDEDGAIIAPLKLVQWMSGRPDAVDEVFVSALTKPEDDFARRDPQTMSGPILERWMCSPYANTIAHQIDLALPGGHAEQIRRVAQNEGSLLNKVSGLFLLITVAALLASGLAVGAAMAAAMFERRREIGIMRSLGASAGMIGGIFVVESLLLSVVAALLGFVAGGVLSRAIGVAVFHEAIDARGVVLPVVIIGSIVVTLAGSYGAIHKAISTEPMSVLRGEA